MNSLWCCTASVLQMRSLSPNDVKKLKTKTSTQLQKIWGPAGKIFSAFLFKQPSLRPHTHTFPYTIPCVKTHGPEKWAQRIAQPPHLCVSVLFSSCPFLSSARSILLSVSHRLSSLNSMLRCPKKPHPPAQVLEFPVRRAGGDTSCSLEGIVHPVWLAGEVKQKLLHAWRAREDPGIYLIQIVDEAGKNPRAEDEVGKQLLFSS